MFVRHVCKANPIMQALKNHQRPRVDRLTVPKNYKILDLGSVTGSMPCTLDVRCEISMFKMSASKNRRGNPRGRGLKAFLGVAQISPTPHCCSSSESHQIYAKFTSPPHPPFRPVPFFFRRMKKHFKNQIRPKP